MLEVSVKSWSRVLAVCMYRANICRDNTQADVVEVETHDLSVWSKKRVRVSDSLLEINDFLDHVGKKNKWIHFSVSKTKKFPSWEKSSLFFLWDRWEQCDTIDDTERVPD